MPCRELPPWQFSSFIRTTSLSHLCVPPICISSGCESYHISSRPVKNFFGTLPGRIASDFLLSGHGLYHVDFRSVKGVSKRVCKRFPNRQSVPSSRRNEVNDTHAKWQCQENVELLFWQLFTARVRPPIIPSSTPDSPGLQCPE